ncbi:MAG: DNA polymerase IV [Halothermotrichaceae bacterium]
MPLDIMHIDMDAFFAAVEQLDNPELKGKPVIVGGTHLDNRGVVSTASYEARKYGVHLAMAIVEAKRLCPDGIFVSGRMKRYQEISAKIFDIFKGFTPLVEKISIDEAFLDLTGCHKLFGDSYQIGSKIKNKIKEELGITASIGLAPNKFLAKLASDMDKPDGFFIIEEDQIDNILEPLSVRKIWGVGKKSAELLESRGIKTIRDLKQLSQNDLKALFGKSGTKLYKLCRGIDNRRVSTEEEVKSISHEETFIEDLADKDSIYAHLMEMSERVSRRMRKKGLRGSTIFIKIRYADFKTYTRRSTIADFINDTDTIYRVGKNLVKRLLNKPVRLLGIGVSNLKKNETTQLSLFDSKKKIEGITKTIDKIKDNFGEKGIFRARSLNGKDRRK